MRILLIVIMITILPFFVNAQSFTPSQIFKTAQQLGVGSPLNPLFPMQEKSPKVPQLETVKPLSLNRVEKAKAKLAREEQKLIKLARKAWDLEDDLKKEEQLLKNLENTPENSNDPDHQKRIEQTKQQITKSQDKLNKAKIDVESSSKKVEGLEKAIEEVKFTRHY